MAPPDHRSAAGLAAAIPALPARRVPAAVAHYRRAFGFRVVHEDGGFAVLARDDAVLHLWEAGDEGWRSRTSSSGPSARARSPSWPARRAAGSR